MNKTLRKPVAFALLVAMSASLPALADMKDFSLMRAIPDNVAMVAHSRKHSGMDFVDKQGERFMKALIDAHLEKDIQKMFREIAKQSQGPDASDSASQEFDQHWQQFSDMIGAIDWESLVDNEFAFAMKFEFPQMVQMVMLSQPKSGETSEAFNGLSKIAQQLVAMAPEGNVALATEGSGSNVTHYITFTQIPVPMAITLARHEDAIMLGIGQSLPEQTLMLLREGEGTTIASTARFQKAFAALPAPEDMVFFADMDKMFKQLNGMIEQGMGAFAPPVEEGDARAAKERALPRNLMNEFDAIDYVAEVATTDGKRTKAAAVAVVKPSSQDKLIYKLMLSGGGLKDPLKYVPQEASSFSVFSGFDLMAAYLDIREFIRDHAPDGEMMLTQFDEGKKEIPFDLENDVLKVIGGKGVTFATPGKSTYSPGDWVMTMALNDADHAATKLQELVEFADAAMKQNNQGAINPANIPGVEGFRTVQSPMLVMMPGMSTPTFGIKDGWFFLGSSPKIMAKAFATASGDAPNFSQNERFQKEGIPLGSEVYYASFADKTKMGDEMSQALAMIPMMGMFVPDINKEPAGRAIMSMATKMSKVVRKLDFFQSSASKTTFDGTTMKTESVMNYREPPQAASSESADAS